MKIAHILLCFLSMILFLPVFSQQTTEIRGLAPDYAGKKLEIYEIEDYLTHKERLIATTFVESDSTFKVRFANNKTQKVVLKSNKNRGILYIQPDASYNVLVPLKNPDGIYRPMGNDIEISFLELDSTDINYKILYFEEWVNSFVMTYYNRSGKDIYNQHFTKFKEAVEKYYASDTSEYLKAYVQYSIYEMEELNPAAKLHRYQVYDAFIKDKPVLFDNDKYMKYINRFYSNVFGQLNMENNNRVYLGLLKNSPTAILNALASEYTLAPTEINTPQGKKYYGNLKLREYVMIKGLAEVFNSPDFPKTNILNVLDSLSGYAIFKENKQIAANLIDRLTELVPGGKAPDFLITTTKGENKTLASYRNKYLYIHFFDPLNKEALKEVELLKNIYAKYNAEVNFLSVYEKNDKFPKKLKEELAKIPWETATVEPEDKILKEYRITAYPQYVLLDVSGYVVAAPALGPKPNNEYLTIDKTFFDIKKVITREKGSK